MDKLQLKEKLIENHQTFTNFILTLNEQEFMFSANNKWTAGQQFDHILRSVWAVKMALSLPKFVPNLLFGKPNRSSTSYENLVSNYQGGLALGGKASGRFIPPAISFNQREALTDKLLRAVKQLCKKIENFTETQLDEHILPHPIIGKLPIREMLYFTIYHVEHHHLAVIKNLEK